VASLSQGRTAAAQRGLFTHKSVPVIFEPPCTTTTTTTTNNNTNNNNNNVSPLSYVLPGYFWG